MSCGLLEKPMLGEPQVSLRDYQADAIEAVRNEFLQGVHSTLVVMPTGAGKTVFFGGCARLTIEKGGRALILVHRKGLIRQAVNTLDMWGIEAGVEGAGQRARSMPFEPDAVVGMVQSLHARRLAEWPRDYFNLLIIDECHHASEENESYYRIIRHFHKARVVGVTATADRADEVPIVGKGQVFETLAKELTLWDLMTAPAPGPYLSRVFYDQVDVNIDLRDLTPKGEDYTDADLAARIEPHLTTLANKIKEKIGDRQTIVFLPRVKTSELMASALHSLGLRAVSTDGEDPDREKIEEGYKRGDYQVLCNVGICTEGSDFPETAAIVLCRPTKSRSLFAQMIGRGLRLKRSYERCMVLDFNYITKGHALVKLTELCDSTKVPTEVLEDAQEMMKADQDLDLVDAIERATKKHKERIKLRIHIQEQRIPCRSRIYDPLEAYEAMGIPFRGSMDKTATPATPKQIELLNKFKIADAEYLSKTRASTLLDYAMSRQKNGLASPAQLRWIIANGVEPEQARKMTKQEASAFLDTVFNRRTG